VPTSSVAPKMNSEALNGTAATRAATCGAAPESTSRPNRTSTAPATAMKCVEVHRDADELEDLQLGVVLEHRVRHAGSSASR
jgi:hypothetical protein